MAVELVVVVVSNGYKGHFKIRRRVKSIKGIEMKGFPMFAVKPLAELLDEQELSVQEMGTCTLLSNAVRTDNVSIVRYHQQYETSKRVQ